MKNFWTAFWGSFKSAYNKAFKQPLDEQVQEYRDTKKYNFLAVFVSKLNNYVNTEATFDINSDGMVTEELDELIKDLEDNRFEITSEMLATGDYWVFPATDKSGKLYHRYVPQDDVRVLDKDGDNITSLIGVVDKFCDNDDRKFMLVRKHTLDGDRLTIETYTTNEYYQKVYFEPWAEFENSYTLTGADNIGVGRFKSPTSSRGLSPVYGVPLNFGCQEIENIIFNDLAMIEQEFTNGKSIIFADPLILRKSNVMPTGYEIPENVFPIDTRGGQTNANIDIFSPAYRYSNGLKDKLFDDLHRYEQEVGTDRGFLTPFESVTATTATEIRRANASTIALIDKIHNSLRQGIESTIKADALFLNIPDYSYTVSINWFDVFADEAESYSRLKEAAKDGFAETTDVMQWLFPNLSLDELEEKLERINEKKQQNLIDFNMRNIDEISKSDQGGEDDIEQDKDKNPLDEQK